MIPTIFISHSCKDHEQQPPAGLPPADLAARAERLAFARKLRDRLHARLKTDERWHIFLDVRGGLEAGDIWQDGLHTALRSCSGGVVLLTPESLESGWVLKETTILSWRVFLREKLILVPIVLGVSEADLTKRGFGALDLTQIQWVRVDAPTDEELDQAVDATVAALSPIASSTLADDQTLPPTERWIQQLAYRLNEVVPQGPTTLRNDYLVRMCQALSIAPEERTRFDADPLINLASQALVANSDQIVRFLNRAGAPTKEQREELTKAVAALWVDPMPASRLLLAAGIGRVVAIDATETRSAREYVLRAFCNDIDPDRIVEPNDVTEGSDQDVIDEIEDSLRQVLPIENAAALTSDVENNGPVFVLLGPSSSRPSVLTAVTGSYPQLTFVTATGTNPRERLGTWLDRAMLLQPLLQPSRETAASRFRNRLVKFVSGGASHDQR